MTQTHEKIKEIRAYLASSESADAKKAVEWLSRNLRHIHLVPALLHDLIPALRTLLEHHSLDFNKFELKQYNNFLGDLTQYQSSLEVERLIRSKYRLSEIFSFIERPLSLATELEVFSLSESRLKQILIRTTYVHGLVVKKSEDKKSEESGQALSFWIKLIERQNDESRQVKLLDARTPLFEEVAHEAYDRRLVTRYDSAFGSALDAGVNAAFMYANSFLKKEYSLSDNKDILLFENYHIHCGGGTYDKVDGESIGLVSAIAALSNLANLPTKEDIAFTGSITPYSTIEGTGIGRVGGILPKIRASIREGIPSIVIPKSSYLHDEQDIKAEELHKQINIHCVEYLFDAVEIAFDITKLKECLKDNITRPIRLSWMIKKMLFIFFAFILLFLLLYIQRKSIYDYWYTFPRDKIGVAITSFSDSQFGHTDDKPYIIHEEDIRVHSKGFIDLSSLMIRRFTKSFDNPDDAIKWGKKKGADIVIWGIDKPDRSRVTLVKSPFAEEKFLVSGVVSEVFSFATSTIFPSVMLKSRDQRNKNNIIINSDFEDWWAKGFKYIDVHISQTTLALVATIHLMNENYPEAIRMYRSFLKSSENPQVLLALASTYATLALIKPSASEWQSAHDALEELSYSDTDDARVWLMAGLLYALMDDHILAIQSYEKSLTMENPLSYLFLSASYSALFEWNKALDALETAVSLAPDEAFLHYLLGNFYLGYFYHGSVLQNLMSKRHSTEIYKNSFYKEDFDRSSKSFRRALEIDKDFKEARYALSINYLKFGLLDKARAILEEDPVLMRIITNAMRGNPSGDVVLYSDIVSRPIDLDVKMVDIEIEFDEIKIEENFQTLINNAPRVKTRLQAYSSLAAYYWKQGKLDKTKEFFENGLIYSPNNIIFIRGLVPIHFHLNEIAHAEELCKRLLVSMPFSIGLRVSLGLIYLAQEKYSESAQLFRNLADTPSLRPFQILRAHLLRWFGDAVLAMGDAHTAQQAHAEARSLLGQFTLDDF
jgi:tetratricopeptide (TPR) repeat protein